MISFSLATRDDDPGIRHLLATNAMPGRIRVRFEREPDYFAGCTENTQVLVARDGGRVVGVACREIRRLFVNGVAEDVGYLGQLRVDRHYRGQLLTARGYRVMRELHGDGRARGYFTTIVDGNAQAEGVLVRNARGVMPRYRFLERLYTLAIRTAPAPVILSRRSAAKDPLIRSDSHAIGRGSFAVFAASKDTGGVIHPNEAGEGSAAFIRLGQPAQPAVPAQDDRSCRTPNLFPAYPPTGQLITVPGASAALNDQRAYKQTVVDGYDRTLSVVRPFYNLVGRIKLPKPNTPLNHAYVTHFQADDAEAARALIEAILAKARGFDHVLFGFTESDPWLAVARRFKPVEYISSIYTVAFDDGDDFHDRLLARPRALDISAL